MNATFTTSNRARWLPIFLLQGLMASPTFARSKVGHLSDPPTGAEDSANYENY
jgi:hypothetical protein